MEPLLMTKTELTQLQAIADRYADGNMRKLGRILVSGRPLGEKPKSAKIIRVAFHLGNREEYDRRLAAIDQLAQQYTEGKRSALFQALADGKLIDMALAEAPSSPPAEWETTEGVAHPSLVIYLGSEPEGEIAKQRLETLADTYTEGSVSALGKILADGDLIPAMINNL